MKRAKIECTSTVDQSTGEPYTIYDLIKVDGNPAFVIQAGFCNPDETMNYLLDAVKKEVTRLLALPDGLAKLKYWLSE